MVLRVQILAGPRRGGPSLSSGCPTLLGDQVQLVTAFSEVEQTASGEKMFVQDKLALHAEEVFRLLQSGAHLYCSGSKFMMPGIQSTLEQSAAAQGAGLGLGVWADGV